MTLSLTPVAFTTSLGLASPAAQAGAQQGVRCPSGSEALIPDGARKLICRIVTTSWQKVISDLMHEANPNGLDKFIATVHEFSFPQGSHYAGDASNGVVYPAGFDGDKTQNDRGIRCDRQDGSPRSADCDGIVGWDWKRDFDGAEDRCRNFVTGESGPTQPEGMTMVQHNLERASDDTGWISNRQAGERDIWQRKVCKFPIH